MKTSSSYIPALDGLRAVSILLVVLSHYGLGWIVPGGLGVTIFFFISGFIITRTLLAELGTRQHLDLPGFYLRRMFRLAPALLCFVLLSNLLFALLGQRVPAGDNLTALFYLANYWQIYGGWGFATIPLDRSPYTILWSLAVEEHFYFFFPLLLSLLWRQPRRMIAATLAICVLVLIWRCVIVVHLGDPALYDQRTYAGTDTRIDSILFGCLLSVAAAIGTADAVPRLLRWAGSRAAFAGALAVLLLTLALRDEVFRSTLRYTLQGLALFVIFARLFVLNAEGWLRRLLEWAPLVWIGRISYSMYLYHWMIMVFVEQLGLRGAVGVLVSVPPMLLASWASFRFIETPIRRIGHRWVEQRLAPRAG